MENPGLRLERLLFWTAPITFATLIVIFISIAFSHQEERVLASCYNKVADLLTSEKDKFRNTWEENQQSIYIYKSEITIAMISKDLACYDLLDSFLDKALGSPETMINKLRKDSSIIFNSPLNFGGVEIPDKAKFSLLGTEIKIEILAFIQSLQFALAPILILWLGSIYHTRYREILLIQSSENISEIFPHLINVFPVGHYPTLKKRSLLRRYAPEFHSLFSTATRIILISTFTWPPILFYLGSIYYLPNKEYVAVFITFGVIIFFYGFVIAVTEIATLRKLFPGPYPLR